MAPNEVDVNFNYFLVRILNILFKVLKLIKFFGSKYN